MVSLNVSKKFYRYTLFAQVSSIVFAILVVRYLNSDIHIEKSAGNPASGFGEMLMVVGGLLMAGFISLIYFLVYVSMFYKKQISFSKLNIFELVTFCLSALFSALFCFLFYVFFLYPFVISG